MPLYETTFIARQDISTHDVEKLTENFSQVIKDNGGTIVKVENWGLRSLAYLVKKSRKGHYVMLGIDSPYEAVKEMERRISLNEDVLRSLTIRVDALDTEPSPMLSARSGHGDDDSIIARDDDIIEGEE